MIFVGKSIVFFLSEIDLKFVSVQNAAIRGQINMAALIPELIVSIALNLLLLQTPDTNIIHNNNIILKHDN